MKMKATLTLLILLNFVSLNAFSQDIPYTTLEGHTDYVTSVAFSPDGLTLASGSNDRNIKLWDVRTGNQFGPTLEGHVEGVNSVAFSPDGLTLASGSNDRNIKLWDVKTGGLLHTLEEHAGVVQSVAFSPDGLTLASGGGNWDATIKLWNVSTGGLIHILEGHESFVYSLAFSPDGQMLASGGENWDAAIAIKLWNVNTGGLPRTLHGHGEEVASVAFSPDGLTLAGGSFDETIKLWNVNTSGLFRTLHGHRSLVRSVAFSPDGLTLASGSFDETIKLWNVNTSGLLHTLHGHEGEVTSVAFSPDGLTLASGSIDKTIKLWNIISAPAKATDDNTLTSRKMDVNADGVVDARLGTMGENVADVKEGTVNPTDLAATPVDPESVSNLVIESVKIAPAAVRPGQTFEISTTVKSKGVSSPATLLFYGPAAIGSGPTIGVPILDFTNTTLKEAVYIASLPPNGISKSTITVTAPEKTGTHYYKVCVASFDGKVDTNENCSQDPRSHSSATKLSG